MAAAFDTLKYAKQLKQAGVPEDQAEIHAEALRGVLEEQITARFDRVDERFDRVDERFAQVDARFVQLDLTIAGIRGEIKLLRWMVSFNLALTAAVLWLLIRSGG
ncbi:MAG: CCDC90 family protein [Pseudomonadota bacterium]|nr:CCDC90 family protein [Pseudomonadota bacterium]